MLLIISEIINVILSVKCFCILYMSSCSATIIFFLFRKEKLNYCKYRYIFYQFFCVGLLFLTFVLIFFSIKFVVARPRPIYVKLGLVENSFSCLSSFPSAHLGLGLMIYFYFFKKSNVWYKIFCIPFLILIGYSRILLDKHYLSDLIGSMFLSPITYVIGNFFIRKSDKLTRFLQIFIYKWYNFLHKKFHSKSNNLTIR